MACIQSVRRTHTISTLFLKYIMITFGQIKVEGEQTFNTTSVQYLVKSEFLLFFTEHKTCLLSCTEQEKKKNQINLYWSPMTDLASHYAQNTRSNSIAT